MRKGKVIDSVVVIVIVVDTKIAKSRKIGVGQTALCHQMVENHENYLMFASNRLGRPTSTTSCVFSLHGHTYQTHLPMPNACAGSTVHA